MSATVNLRIGGREFKVACAPGEEDHVTALGRVIDEKVATLGLAGQGEGRMFLFAALMLADEVHELRGKAISPASQPASFDENLCARLEAMADALEKCAMRVEDAAKAP